MLMISLFCRHDWDLIDKTITQSRLEHTINSLDAYQGSYKINVQNTGTERKVIYILKCKKCGELKKFVEDI